MRRKILLPALCVLSLFLAACGSGTSDIPEEPNNPEEEAWQQSVQGQVDAGEDIAPRVIRVSAKNWEFSPSTITVAKGEAVTLELVSQEGTHGFAVPGLGINVSVTAGQAVTVAIPTDTAGTFEFFCSIPCGSGHSGMRGTIVVEA